MNIDLKICHLVAGAIKYFRYDNFFYTGTNLQECRSAAADSKAISKFCIMYSSSVGAAFL
jgi:hypothetical protein